VPEKHSRTLTLTARGPAAVALLLLTIFGVFGLPRLLATPPSAAEAEHLIRLLRARQVNEAYDARLREAAPDTRSAIAAEMAAALRRTREEPLGVTRVKRGWVGPPFSYSWTYFVEVGREGKPPATYRIRRGLVSEAHRFWWHIPII
jgi:hypothetical protein